MRPKELKGLYAKWGEELSDQQAHRMVKQWEEGGAGLSRGVRVMLRMVESGKGDEVRGWLDRWKDRVVQYVTNKKS